MMALSELFAGFVYKRCLYPSGLFGPRAAWKWIRGYLIRHCSDPGCRIDIHGWKLRIPLSHQLPFYLSRLPYYDRLPGRMVEYLLPRQEQVGIVDVGANIGDLSLIHI